MSEIRTFGGGNTRPFHVRIVRTGDRYGLSMMQVHTERTPLVEFYDAEGDAFQFGPLGQFVSSYNMETLVARHRGVGLCLDGGIPEWSVDAGIMDQILDWVSTLKNTGLW